MRKHECENYAECLNIAAKGDFDFSCDGCNGKTIIDGLPVRKKRGRLEEKATKGKDASRNRIYVDFTNYPELFDTLTKEAKREVRSLSNQILFHCIVAIGKKGDGE